MLEDYLDDVLEKLRSDSCRRAAAACPTMVDAAMVNDEKLRDAGCELHCCCIRAGYQQACGPASAEGWHCVWQGYKLPSDSICSERMCRDARSHGEQWHTSRDL